MVLKDVAIKDKLPPESIVGNLDDLYKKMVASERPVDRSYPEKKFRELRNKIDNQ
jgi:hypothetical protein